MLSAHCLNLHQSHPIIMYSGASFTTIVGRLVLAAECKHVLHTFGPEPNLIENCQSQDIDSERWADGQMGRGGEGRGLKASFNTCATARRPLKQNTICKIGQCNKYLNLWLNYRFTPSSWPRS